MKRGIPEDIAAINREIRRFEEGLGSRIGRHMTNQRTDAVAMNVLDR